MLKDKFQEELARLKDIGDEFASQYPSIAPMLAGITTDPDVDRLLEGIAFINANVKEKIDDDFPKFIQELVRIVYPHQLHHIPSIAMIEFSSGGATRETIKIEQDTELYSKPVDDIRCKFCTSYDLDLIPLEITNSRFIERSEKSNLLEIDFELLNGLTVKDLSIENLKLHLSNSYNEASEIFGVLTRNVEKVTFISEGIPNFVLEPEKITCPAFSGDQQLLPYPSNSNPAFNLIQEFFVLPESFLFINISGLENWRRVRGNSNSFQISFDIAKNIVANPKVQKNSFKLHVVPAVNLFSTTSSPITLDHKQERYEVNVESSDKENFQAYDVKSVMGFIRNRSQREYLPFDFVEYDKVRPRYSLFLNNFGYNDKMQMYISFLYPNDSELFAEETISINLRASNGNLPSRLSPGDINHTSGGPAFVTFSNINYPTAKIDPPLDDDMLWKFLSQLSQNYTSFESIENIQRFFNIFNTGYTKDKKRYYVNEKRIQALEAISLTDCDKIYQGVVLRGVEVRIKIKSDNFSCSGDIILFGNILDYFFANFISINSFTRLIFEDSITGETNKWNPRLGNQILL